MQVLLKGTLLVTGHSRALPPDAAAPAVGARPAASAPADGAPDGARDGARNSGAQGGGPQGNGGAARGGKGEAAGGRWAVDVEHRGPSVVLWLWEAVAGGGEVVLRPQAIRFTAGPEGAPAWPSARHSPPRACARARCTQRPGPAAPCVSPCTFGGQQKKGCWRIRGW